MSELSAINFESAYASLIAGAIPLHSGDVDKTVFMMVQDMLGTPKMHLLVAIDAPGEMVYYFAAPSAAFTSIPVFSTPLASALPSHPQHRGDGIYFLQGLTLAVAVEKTRDHLRVVANTIEVMAEWLAEHDPATIYRVDNDVPWTMESIPGAYRRLVDGISLRTAKYSAVVGIGALVLYLVASLGTSFQRAAADKSNQAHIAAINNAVGKIDFISPLSQQVARLQKVSALVVRSGGWVEEYELKNDTEKFILMMPSWITKDYIDALGPKIEADQANEENLLRVSLNVPLPGTTPVPRDLIARPVAIVPAPGTPATGSRAGSPTPASMPTPMPNQGRS